MYKKNIILIGMPSSGKSTIGISLAQQLAMKFVDTDMLICQNENRSPKDIVNSEGLESFLKIQESNIISLNENGCVIATGGSVVYSDASMKHLGNNGVVVYLEIGLEEVEKRVTAGRRFARKENQSFTDIYYERVPLYQKYADIIIDCSGKNVEELVLEIKNELVKYCT
jgi:shikimate kinase